MMNQDGNRGLNGVKTSKRGRRKPIEILLNNTFKILRLFLSSLCFKIGKWIDPKPARKKRTAKGSMIAGQLSLQTEPLGLGEETHQALTANILNRVER